MRRLGALVGATALAAGTGVLLAAPAGAASISGTPSYDPGTKVVSATVTRTAIETVKITLTGPSGYAYGIESGGLGNPTTVGFRAPNVLRNGAYTLTVTSNLDSSPPPLPVNVEALPTAPTVTASSAAVGSATVSWTASPEPDVTGYAVQTGGTTVRSTGRCSTCSTTITGLTPGKAYTFTVVATRSCPTCKGGTTSAQGDAPPVTVRSSTPPSSTASPVPTDSPSAGTGGPPGPGTGGGGATTGVSGAPTPDPSVTPTGTPSPGTSTGPSPSAGPAPGIVSTVPRQGVSSFGGFSGFGTALSVPGLTLGGKAPTLATARPRTPDGTYDPQLAYGSQIRETSVSSTGGGGSSALGPIGDAVDSEQLMRTLAAALILLLTGAHLRRWLSDSSRPTH